MSTTPPTVPAVAILIAEDSPTQSMLLEDILQRHGFQVVAARNGRLAWEALDAGYQAAMVISDIQMPEMDGYALCRQIKANEATRGIPVILLTSLSAPQDIIRGLECGADNFVVKPYEEEFLMARVRSILLNRELRKSVENDQGIAVHFAGERYVITSDRRQILNLLLSTYETAVKTNLDLIKAHEELKAAQAQLIEAEKLQSVGRLAAGVAHEVRNPLAIMEMGIAYLGDQAMADDGQLILNEMKEAVARANIVISSLMDLTSPRQLGRHEASLNDAVKEALAAAEKDLTAGEIRVVRELAEELPLSRVDSSKIEQVFLNLFTNAIHSMPQGGTLTVRSALRGLTSDDVAYDAGDRSGARLRDGEQAVVIEVQDTGTGIAPENLGLVFDPFFSTKPTGKGMGLGLTVARKIVEAHLGKVRISSPESGGTLVTLTFKQI